MPPIDPDRAQALFHEAIRLPDASARAAFLDRECGGDADLKARVEALLRGHDQLVGDTGTTARPTETVDTESPPGAETIDNDRTTAHERGPDRTTTLDAGGDQTGGASSGPPAVLIADRYELRQAIGEGGMGTVYLAEQLRPVRRRVALKLIKPGMDSRQVIARFDSERQALAMMDHPNIAKVLDAGTTPDGRPFFVMELVKGVPLTEYCDRERLGLPSRLELFRQICSAVQHAHQKGIIHRDLKPSNILVESHDGKPVPKVIDFGLAKATAGQVLTERSLDTAFGSVAGTPLYMAPEQAGFDATDIDTRADIYSLGVILYELLTGSTPISRDSIRRKALDEMLRVIREEEPPSPSSRLGSSESLPSVAANRHTEPSRLSRFVKGDLDWIAMKALSKERERRYDSAMAMADDVGRFLNHEPVTAGPPTASYRVRKFVRRNRGRVLAAGLVLLAMLAGIAGTTVGMVRARRAAEQERLARLEAQRNLGYARQGNRILGSVFIGLDPEKIANSGRPLQDVLRENLTEAVAELESAAIGDPLEVAEMQDTLGTSLMALGEYTTAEGILQKAVSTLGPRRGPGDAKTLRAQEHLAQSYILAGELDRAIALFEKILPIAKSSLGVDDYDTLSIMTNLAVAYREAGRADQARALTEECLPIKKRALGPDHPETLASMHNLTVIYWDAGQLELARPLAEQVYDARKAKLGADHPETLESLNAVATLAQDAGELDRAIPLFEELVALRKSRLGPDHPETIGAIGNLAAAYLAAGKLDRAIELGEQALALSKSKLGPDHLDTVTSMNNLGMTYLAAKQPEEAFPLIEEVAAQLKKQLGADHPHTITTMSNQAMIAKDLGRLDRALPLAEEALALRKAKLGADHPDAIASLNNLAMVLDASGDLDRATPLLEEAVSLSEKKQGPDHPNTRYYRAQLGRSHLMSGRPDLALTLLEDARLASQDDPRMDWVPAALLAATARTGGAEKAGPLADAMLAEGRASVPADSPAMASLLAGLGEALLADGTWERAESLLRESLAIRERDEPEAWSTFDTRSLLGASLAGQKKNDEAGPLLRSGYDGMKAHAAQTPYPARRRRLSRAIESLINLAEATGHADEAKALRDEKAAVTSPVASEPK